MVSYRQGVGEARYGGICGVAAALISAMSCMHPITAFLNQALQNFVMPSR